MNNEEYSKREIDSFMQEIRETLIRIEAQTTKTNGRVSKLENWRGYITGGVSVIVIVLIPLLLMVVNTYFKK